jgi:hypothetical protein
MATEDASYISELNAAYPADGDAVGEGGGTTTGTGSTRGHLNMIKYALKTQFSGLTGTTAITSSEAEMNLVDGCTATTNELNYLDITTLGTSENSKALTQNASGEITIGTGSASTGVARGAPITITQGTLIDLDTGNNFLWTPGGDDELSFANETTGQSGFIKLINPSAHVITKASEVKASSTFITDVTVAGTYLITYFCDGTDVYVSASAALS